MAILDVGFVGGTISISYFMLHGNSRINVIGLICAALNIINCSSPLGIAVSIILSELLSKLINILFDNYLFRSTSSFFVFINYENESAEESGEK